MQPIQVYKIRTLERLSWVDTVPDSRFGARLLCIDYEGRLRQVTPEQVRVVKSARRRLVPRADVDPEANR